MADAKSATERDSGSSAGITRERLQALAEHFDLTDAAELPWEEATDVEIRRPELEQISLRLPKDDLAQLKVEAARASIGYTTLIRMVIRRYLREARETGI